VGLKKRKRKACFSPIPRFGGVFLFCWASAPGCGVNGSTQHLDGLGDAIARACLISITGLQFHFLFFHSCLYNIRSRFRQATGKP